ncbi:hypothetical protein PVAP13_9KG239813 [Panicum virgatum]|uniref:Squalene monooxygenase n=1 Tax=Panicum virgatum TaxID=38727 RepID=A0A8T0NLJ4_PANVG|nr:hypothetical protein PVAP13_9KG239813 [Panicum virgatum]
MRRACFDYLSLGGVFSGGIACLLSGLDHRPASLLAHFLAVSVYGVGRLLFPLPTAKRIWMASRLVLGACGIFFSLIRAEGIRQMFFPASIPTYYRASHKPKMHECHLST